MSADNYVRIRRFGEGDCRWGNWFGSCDHRNILSKEYPDAGFDLLSFTTPMDAAPNVSEELCVIEYGIEFEACCWLDCLTEMSTYFTDKP